MPPPTLNTSSDNRLNLATYHISPTTGFVPSPPPLTRLPPYFAAWDDLASRLPSLLAPTGGSPTLRHKVLHDLPVLDAKHLGTIEELRRAYVVLGFLVHGFAHSTESSAEQDRTDADEEPVRIPAQLAQPYIEVCARLGLEGRETLAYAGLCSWNWTFINNGEEDWELGKMKSLVTFTGTRHEEVFYLVPVLMEREVGPVMEGLVEVVQEIQDDGEGDAAGVKKDQGLVGRVKDVLIDLKHRIVKMQSLMKLLHEQCSPTVFWTQVRPYFPGGKGGAGWVFELADGSEVTRWCVGGSAAQSATFPFLDAVLGIKHAKMGGEISVFEEMREYMPGEQRPFVAAVEKKKSIGEFVECRKEDEEELLVAYNAVLEELAKWRSKHIAVVTTHIVNQARKEKKEPVKAEEVMEGLSVKDESDLQGTGGSALIPFLKGARKDTEAARR